MTLLLSPTRSHRQHGEGQSWLNLARKLSLLTLVLTPLTGNNHTRMCLVSEPLSLVFYQKEPLESPPQSGNMDEMKYLNAPSPIPNRPQDTEIGASKLWAGNLDWGAW